MQLGPTTILDTFAEAFGMRYARLVVTAADEHWLDAALREATGYAIGGVAPVGHPAPLRTLVDVDLARHDVVWAAAGHPHAVFPTTYDELLRLTGGTPTEVV